MDAERAVRDERVLQNIVNSSRASSSSCRLPTSTYIYLSCTISTFKGNGCSMVL